MARSFSIATRSGVDVEKSQHVQQVRPGLNVPEFPVDDNFYLLCFCSWHENLEAQV